MLIQGLHSQREPYCTIHSRLDSTVHLTLGTVSGEITEKSDGPRNARIEDHIPRLRWNRWGSSRKLTDEYRDPADHLASLLCFLADYY